MSNPQHESHCFVEFRMEPVEFKAESEKSGRPIFKEVPFIKIIIPGDRNNEIDTKVTEHYKQKFPVAWARFQAGLQSGAPAGTPLEQWPQISRSQVREANYFEVRTVEQLAELSDVHCQRLGMGFSELRGKAKTYLNLANTAAEANETQNLKDQLATQQEQINALLAAAASQAEPMRNKPGPKKKEAVAA